jgi:signal transduction histidine kinase
MVALAMSIEQTDRVLTGAAGDARMFLVQCREHLDRCIGDLRELVRGIYPPVLATRGLAAALRARARLGAGEVRVTVGDGVDGVRFGEEVELAAYFACLEALQNAAKHAPGSRVVVALDVDGASLCFEVRDDGPGFDPDAVAGGTGLVGLADRVGAAGGELTVTSTPGAGTAVRGRLPLLLPLPLPLP